jgi:hypothetical protein
MKYYIIFFIIIIIMMSFCLRETFHDFKNLPNNYNVEDINKSPSGKVPKIIHRICPKKKSEWHDSWFYGYDSWLKVFPQPEYTHMLWFDDELEELIKSDFPWFLEIFKSYNYNIYRIDMIRPFILYKYGGIYADMDYVALKNFYNELPENIISIPESPYKKHEFIQNSLLCSPPLQNFWLLLVEEAINNKDQLVFFATGPALYTNLYNKHKNLINILPMNLYNPAKESPEFNSPDVITKHYASNVWIGEGR